VVVLGAGLAGVCTALGLARRGRPVTIIDQTPGCLRRASLRNEGKVHLGFVYANDPDGRTPALMLDGALRFDRAVEEALGAPLDWRAIHSTRVVYVVLAGTMRSPGELAESYAALQDHYDGARADNLTYLGTRLDTLWRPLPESTPNWLAAGASVGAFETAELALDVSGLCRSLRHGLERAEGVERRWHHRVESASRTGQGYRIDGLTGAGEAWSIDAAVVVNCLWEDRLRLDAQLDLAPDRPIVHRLKYRLLGRLPAFLAGLPSFTFVLGPFGDVVTWPSGRVYLSWYPSCMRGWTSELAVPGSWQAACNGLVDPETTDELKGTVLRELDSIVPGLGATAVDTVDAGVITAWGATDIDDPGSELHGRHELGPHATDGWVTLNTGKLTTAPWFAQQAVDLAIDALR
jgi:glycine/D-amino acid oxidase-like deaminating enzyme